MFQTFLAEKHDYGSFTQEIQYHLINFNAANA